MRGRTPDASEASLTQSGNATIRTISNPADQAFVRWCRCCGCESRRQATRSFHPRPSAGHCRRRDPRLLGWGDRTTMCGRPDPGQAQEAPDTW